MIADNLSFPRDHQLLVNYKGFLKIILCGTDKGINTDYLDLAKKYGFTLHTLKSDIISQLKKINNGQRITIVDSNIDIIPADSSGFIERTFTFSFSLTL